MGGEAPPGEGGSPAQCRRSRGEGGVVPRRGTPPPPLFRLGVGVQCGWGDARRRLPFFFPRLPAATAVTAAPLAATPSAPLLVGHVGQASEREGRARQRHRRSPPPPPPHWIPAATTAQAPTTASHRHRPSTLPQRARWEGATGVRERGAPLCRRVAQQATRPEAHPSAAPLLAAARGRGASGRRRQVAPEELTRGRPRREARQLHTPRHRAQSVVPRAAPLAGVPRCP